MIKQFVVNGFKSHKNTDINFKNLTVLCGSNGVGKSSLIHALLLLRESYLKKTDFKYLDLLSNPIKVGNLKDAIYQKNSFDGFVFNLQTELSNYEFNFENSDSNFTKTLIKESQKKANKVDFKLIDMESLFNNDFQYISAARLGPQEVYSKDDVIVEIHKQISVIEGKSEYCVHYLAKNQDKKILEKLIHKNNNINDLIHQVSAWDKEISEGVNVVINDLGKLGYELKYEFENDIKGKTNQFYASNVGFGITYVLPILVAILSAKPGALIIIENPEAHLHPKGISKLIELICIATQAGIQIIIETHSDHIINGILVQSKKHEINPEHGIARENVSIYQFERNETEHCSIAQKIEVEEGGKIINPPNGFFDQIQNDLTQLLGF